MKLGIVVDGVSEFASFSCLYEELCCETGNQFLKPLKADIQPYAPIGVIAKQCSDRVMQHLYLGADLVVVLLDREARDECPGRFATLIKEQIATDAVSVVIKDRMFENWLVSDLDALKAQPARFEVSRGMERLITSNADGKDALALLKRATRRRAYDKVVDSKRILERASCMRMGTRSRSFRRFLRVAGVEIYQDQSRRPK